MRRNRPPRPALHRFAIISVALVVVLLGYYLGNRYQFGQLQNSVAILFEQPIELVTTELPLPLRREVEAEDKWVLVLAGRPGDACDKLLGHYIEVVNRLAAWPAIQERLQLIIFNSGNRPPGPAWKNVEWAHVQEMPETQILRLTGQLGIAPLGTRWCQDVQATTALIGPVNRVHALLPLDKPEKIAESLRLIIEAHDPDV